MSSGDTCKPNWRCEPEKTEKRKAVLARCERMLSTNVVFQEKGCENMERVAAVTRARAVRMMLERSGMTPNGTEREPCSRRRANRCNTSTSATQIYMHAY